MEVPTHRICYGKVTIEIEYKDRSIEKIKKRCIIIDYPDFRYAIGFFFIKSFLDYRTDH